MGSPGGGAQIGPAWPGRLIARLMLGLTLPAPDRNEPQQQVTCDCWYHRRYPPEPRLEEIRRVWPVPAGFEPDPHVCTCTRTHPWRCPVHPALGHNEALAWIEAQQIRAMMVLPPSASLLPPPGHP